MIFFNDAEQTELSEDSILNDSDYNSDECNQIESKSYVGASNKRILNNLQNLTRSEIEEHLSFLRNFYANVKGHVHSMFYPCFMDKLNYTNFTRNFDRYFSRNRKKKQYNCACPLASIPRHNVYNCKDFNHWMQAHFEILMRCFDFIESFVDGSSVYDFEDFANFAYRYSSPCNCYEIEFRST
jgi:hypothetical protein